MALIVEDGTGKPDADSYISAADADAYHVALGNTAWAGAADAKDQALRRATRYIDARYRWRWIGERTFGRDQALEWPRWIDGSEISDDEIPIELTRATAEAALRELASPGSLTPDVTPSERVKREQVGPIAVEYEFAGSAATAVRPVVTLIDEMLAPLLTAVSMTATAVRG